MEEQPTLQRMMIQEIRTRPDPNDSNRLIATVHAYGTDHNRYEFEVQLPVAVAEQIHRGNYVTTTVGKDRIVHAFVWAFPATDGRDTIAPELKRVTIHDISLNVRVSGMAADPEHYFVQVGGYPSEGNPYIVEFEAPLEIARKLKGRDSVDLLVDSHNIAREIVIGDVTLDVTHVGKP